MRRLRHVLLVVFFVGLVALEIAHGVFRLDTLRREARAEWASLVEREQGEVARALASTLSGEREHAAYLARSTAVAAFLAGGDAASLEDQVLPYLVSFRGIDRVRLLDREGHERFRAERVGQAVGVLPATMLAAEPDREAAELAEALAPGAVEAARLVVDAARVEVPSSAREVLDFVAPVFAGDGSRVGVLVLTVYAAPLLEAVRRLEPVPGVRSALLDEQARVLAATPGYAAGGAEPAAAAALPEGRFTAPDGGEWFSVVVADAPPWTLRTELPAAVLARAGPVDEYVWVIGTMVAITGVLILAGLFFLRLSRREIGLREERRHLARERELEQKLASAERLSSLGLLTAGVAHEINNPLEGIGNYLSLLERDPTEAKRARYLDQLRHGFQRIRDIVRDLSSFARPSAADGRAELGAVVRRAGELVHYTPEFRDVELELSGFDEERWVAGDAGRLEQVFLNLLLNAAQAMRGGGRVGVVLAAPAPGRFAVRVEDQGPGIPEADLERIFEPFFSSKEGSGSGLGLSVSYGIVRSHGGRLTAANLPAGGAVFMVELSADGPGGGSGRGSGGAADSRAST